MAIKTQADLDAESGEKPPIEGEATVVENEEGNETVDEQVDSGEADEWGDLLDEDDVDEDIAALHDEDEAPAEAEEAEGEGEAEDDTAASEESQEAEPEPEVTDTTDQVEVPETTEEEIPTKTPEEQQAEFEAARNAAEDELAEKYQLTEDEADELIAEPNKVLPKMMAKMYLDMFGSVMQSLHQQMPSMVQGVVQTTEREAAGKKAFFEAWPQLNKPEYSDAVKRIAESYKQMNPKVTGDEFIKEVGAQAWVALRLPLDELLSHTQGKGTPPPADPKVTQLRQPASPGNVPVQGKTPAAKPLNDFEAFAEELIQDDQ